MGWCANNSIKCLISYEKFLYLWKKMFRLLELYIGTYFCCYCCSGCVLLERISSISRKPYLYLFNLSPPWLEVLLAIAAGVVIQFNYFMPIYIFSHNHLVTTFGQWQTKSFLNNSKRNLKCIFLLCCMVQLQPWHKQTIFGLHVCLLISIRVLLEKVTEVEMGSTINSSSPTSETFPMTLLFYYVFLTHSAMTIADILSFYLTSSFSFTSIWTPTLLEKIEAVNWKA